MLSVPYALHANSASLRVSEIGDTLFSGKNYVLIPGISVANEAKGDTNIPSVVIDSVYKISVNYASLTARVTDSGVSATTARGFCYGTSSSPNLGDSAVSVALGTGVGTFTSTISNLTLEHFIM